MATLSRRLAISLATTACAVFAQRRRRLPGQKLRVRLEFETHHERRGTPRLTNVAEHLRHLFESNGDSARAVRPVRPGVSRWILCSGRAAHGT